MARKEQITQAAKQAEKEGGFAQIVKDAKGVNSAYGIGFVEGAEWADKHSIELKEVDLKKEFFQWWKDERAKDYNVDILYERYSNVSMKLAKYFFELGMAVSNKAQKGK